MSLNKFFLFIIILANSTIIFSQNKIVKKDSIQEGWVTKGKLTFLFSQSAFSNWTSGGENNVAGNIGLNYDFNYIKDKLTWNNRFIASYGLVKTQNTEFEKKTDDRLELNSIVGLNADKNWYYSLIFNFKTQLTTGYIYEKNDEGIETRREYTEFMSPANIILGPGMLWEKSKNLNVNIAPATAKLVIVNKDFTLPNNEYFGVEQGKSTRFELGFNAAAYGKFTIMENTVMENILALYANYLENPQNIDIDYTMNITMKINKSLSTNITFQTIYDDNAYKGFQIREVFGLGVNYDF